MGFQASAMRYIHFVGGEKGGVGKSVVSRVLAQLFIDRDVPFQAFDADTSHPSLRRHYRDQTEVLASDASNPFDAVIEAALNQRGPVVVDLPARGANDLFAWFEDGAVAELADEAGISMIFWHVSDGGHASVNELEKLLSRVPERVGLVVVKNRGRGRHFAQLEESQMVETLLARGGAVVDFPELDGDAMYSIDRHGSSFWAAMNDTRSPLALTVMARRRTRIWLERAYKAVESVAMPRLRVVPELPEELGFSNAQEDSDPVSGVDSGVLRSS